MIINTILFISLILIIFCVLANEDVARQLGKNVICKFCGDKK
jgi:hypothetical protein